MAEPAGPPPPLQLQLLPLALSSAGHHDMEDDESSAVRFSAGGAKGALSFLPQYPNS